MKRYTVITGASSGIGAATAKLFAEKGKNLILVARRLERLEQLREEILTHEPAVDIKIKVVDLSETGQVYKLYEDLKEVNIETWINNAGFGDFSTIAEQSLATIESMLAVNISALTLLSTLYVKGYQDVEGAQLINVSSGAGYNLYPNCVTYTVSKFFVSSFTENLAHELRNAGAKLAVKLVVPEATETEFIQVASKKDEEANFSQLFDKYHTAGELAEHIWTLYKSQHIVGQVDDLTYVFHLHDGQFPYKGRRTEL